MEWRKKRPSWKSLSDDGSAGPVPAGLFPLDAVSPDPVFIDPLTPSPEMLARAARIITGGGVVVFPTRGLYGLAADALNPAAVDRVFRLKGRPSGKPILVLVHRLEDVLRLTTAVPLAAQILMARFWPGGLTLVLPAAPRLPANLTSGTGAIGIRLASHPVAVGLAKAVGGPITGTSANLSGDPAAATVAAISPEILAGADLILDAGPLAGGSGSTVVEVTGPTPRILREGAVPAREILALFPG